MKQKFNNEVVGISAEIAIADTFNVLVDEEYRKRGNEDIANLLKRNILNIFQIESIPKPLTHVAEGQNPIDFILENGETLSVKTNKRELGKVAPQIIGQPTNETYFLNMKNKFPNISEFDILNELRKRRLEDNYINRSKIFKDISMKYIDIIINEYWKNLVECDYLLLFYNVVDKNENLLTSSKYIVLRKELKLPNWSKNNFLFTKSFEDWNESNTLKYDNNGEKISIGEFQVHKKRNCFKFRFNIKNILKIINY